MTSCGLIAISKGSGEQMWVTIYVPIYVQGIVCMAYKSTCQLASFLASSFIMSAVKAVNIEFYTISEVTGIVGIVVHVQLVMSNSAQPAYIDSSTTYPLLCTV